MSIFTGMKRLFRRACVHEREQERRPFDAYARG
jgi:hypothetical protein